MDQLVHNVRREHWLNIINSCQARNEGTSVKQWLKDNGISNKSYYYWLRRFRKEAYEQMKPDSESCVSSLAEIPIHDSSSYADRIESDFKADAIIKTDDFVIALSNTASETLCRTIMEGLCNAR